MRKVVLVLVGLCMSASLVSALGIREYVREYQEQLRRQEQELREAREAHDAPLEESERPARETEPDEEEAVGPTERPGAGEPDDMAEGTDMEPEFTPPSYGMTDVDRYRVARQTIRLTLLGRYSTGLFDEGASEIVAFDPVTNVVLSVNAANGSVDVIDISNPRNPSLFMRVTAADAGLSGTPNSVAVHAGIGLGAVVLEAPVKTDPGILVLVNRQGQVVNTIQVGALPDMVTFSPDGRYVLVANEGEPNDDYSVDPEGSVTIVDLQGGAGNVNAARVMTATFSEDDIVGENVTGPVRINGPGASFAQDLEPEYIAVDSTSTYAFVALQENNAGALIHIPSGTTRAIASLGHKDYSVEGRGLDPSDRDDVNYVRTYKNLWGMYMPDGIDTFVVNGVEYLIAANEGDGREYDDFSDEARLKDLSLDRDSFSAEEIARYMMDEHLGRLTVSTTDGDTDGDGDIDVIHAFGGRSVTIWNTVTGEQMWDSGDAFEVITAALAPDYFNTSNDNLDRDNRSDNKGPEPEGVEIGYWGDRVFAFVGLERVGGIMVFDVTDPAGPIFQQWINTRNWNASVDGDGDYTSTSTSNTGDLAPEGLVYVSPADSPTGNALLIVGFEVSGSVGIFEITPVR